MKLNHISKSILKKVDKDIPVKELKKADSLLGTEINYVIFRKSEYKAKKRKGIY